MVEVKRIPTSVQFENKHIAPTPPPSSSFQTNCTKAQWAKISLFAVRLACVHHQNRKINKHTVVIPHMPKKCIHFERCSNSLSFLEQLQIYERFALFRLFFCLEQHLNRLIRLKNLCCYMSKSACIITLCMVRAICLASMYPTNPWAKLRGSGLRKCLLLQINFHSTFDFKLCVFNSKK